jgi:hypothetical protein
MLPDKKAKTNIGVGVGLVLQIAARFLVNEGEFGPRAPIGLVALGFVIMVIGFAFFIWGCMNYAEGKGYSKQLGWLGLLSCLGLLVMVCLPDRHKGAR